MCSDTSQSKLFVFNTLIYAQAARQLYMQCKAHVDYIQNMHDLDISYIFHISKGQHTVIYNIDNTTLKCVLIYFVKT